jgi:hypothetical protein
MATLAPLAPSSVEFLLKDHEQLWLQLRHMYGYLLKVYAFYVAVFGATFAATIKLLSDRARGTDPTALLASPWTLPAWFVESSVVLIVLLTTTLLLHTVKHRVVSTEYADALNAIRLAFVEHDAQMARYLKLPTGPFGNSKWWNIDFFSYAAVDVLSGLLLASVGLYLAYANMSSPAVCGSLLVVVVLGLWCVPWLVLWSSQLPTRG